MLPDRDNYSVSQDGVVSIRSYEGLPVQLAEIDIFLDKELSTSELHFFKLPRIYSEEQIAKLRDFSKQDIERIQEIILPESPMPNLYRLLLEMNRMIYFETKNMSDKFLQDTLMKPLMEEADATMRSYLNFANVRTQTTWARSEMQAAIAKKGATTIAKAGRATGQNLLNLWVTIVDMKNRMANVENLRALHHRQIGQILAKLLEIEKIVEREYGKILRETMNLKALKEKK